MDERRPPGRAAARLARLLRTTVSPGRRRWIGLTAMLVLAALVLGRDDLARMTHSFAAADWRWVAPSAVLLLASLALRSLSLQVIVNAIPRIRSSFRDALSATSIGLLANAVVPARVGTVLSPYVLFALLRRKGQPLAFPTALGVTLTERMFAITTFLVITVLSLGTLAAPAWTDNVLLVSTGLIAVPFVVGILVERRPGIVHFACDRWGRVGVRLRRWLPQLAESQRIMGRPHAAFGVAATQAAAWALQLAAAVTMLWAFHVGAAGLRGAALVIVLTNLIGLVPATPGNVGTFQVAAVAALAAHGVGAGPALAYALGLQALQLLVGVVAGLVSLTAQELTLADLAGKSRQAAATLRGETPPPAAELSSGSWQG